MNPDQHQYSEPLTEEVDFVLDSKRIPNLTLSSPSSQEVIPQRPLPPGIRAFARAAVAEVMREVRARLHQEGQQPEADVPVGEISSTNPTLSSNDAPRRNATPWIKTSQE